MFVVLIALAYSQLKDFSSVCLFMLLFFTDKRQLCKLRTSIKAFFNIDVWTLPLIITVAGQSLRVRISLSQLYGSSVAASLICQAVCQTAMTRTLLCRDLLILQQLYLRIGDNVSRHTHIYLAHVSISLFVILRPEL